MMQNNIAAEKQMLSVALCEALSEKFDSEVKNSSHTAECSANHENKMRLIVAASAARKPKRLPIKRIIAIIAIVALLLTGCAIYVFREQIFGFNITIKDGGATLETETPSEHLTIENVYALTYIPKGYKLATEWKNDNRRVELYASHDPYYSISFSQSTNDIFLKKIDIEHSTKSTLEINGIDILCYDYSDESATYIWSCDGYVFDLSISFRGDRNNEFVKIFNGIKVDTAE